MPWRLTACQKCEAPVHTRFSKDRPTDLCYECRKAKEREIERKRRQHGDGWAHARWELNGKRCWWCGKVTPWEEIHADHVIPLSKGGGGGGNLVPSCGPCNWSKHDLAAPLKAKGAIPDEMLPRYTRAVSVQFTLKEFLAANQLRAAQVERNAREKLGLPLGENTIYRMMRNSTPRKLDVEALNSILESLSDLLGREIKVDEIIIFHSEMKE